jgi:hypothetical protein
MVPRWLQGLVGGFAFRKATDLEQVGATGDGVPGAVIEKTLRSDGGTSESLSGGAKIPVETARADDRVSPAHDGRVGTWRRREPEEGSDRRGG